jgi:hypothetical protein
MDALAWNTFSKVVFVWKKKSPYKKGLYSGTLCGKFTRVLGFQVFFFGMRLVQEAVEEFRQKQVANFLKSQK